MIREFAVDPAVFSDWKSFRYFYEQFGVSQGRLISRFPSRWKKLVYEHLKAQKLGDIELHRIVDRLSSVDDKLLRQSREYDSNRSWAANVTDGAVRPPFHAIVTNDRAAQGSNVLQADEVDENHPLWTAERQVLIPRTAEAISSVVAPLLGVSQRMLLVDPHFDPDRLQYRETLAAICLFIQGLARPFSVEIHFFDNGRKAAFDHQFKANCENKLAPIIPAEMQLKLLRWRARAGGPGFHARYVLTERGGVLFENGLDTGAAGQTTPVFLLSSDLHEKVMRTFFRVHDIDALPYILDGEMRVVGRRDMTAHNSVDWRPRR